MTMLFLAFQFTFSQEVHWASKVVKYSSQKESKKFSAKQILDKPSINELFGRSPCAWMPIPRSMIKREFIQVEFSNFIHAQQIIINESFIPGAIEKVFLIDSAGQMHLEYYMPKADRFQIGRVKTILINKTPYKVHGAKIILDTKRVGGACQIDAIGISDSRTPYQLKINLPKNKLFRSTARPLGPFVNTKYQELAPVVSHDGRSLFFTREKGYPENVGSDKNQDVYTVKLKNGLPIDNSKNMGFPINSIRNNFALSITPDGNSLILGNTYKATKTPSLGLAISYNLGDSWSYPDRINILNYYNKVRQESHCLGPDARTIISSLVRDDTYGGHDLYYSKLLKDGNWSEPKNLGKINTASSEQTPFLASDGKTLYFTTSGYPGYGNTDIFMSRRLDDTWTNWTEPVNLGPLVNSSEWDAYFTIQASGEYAFFVSAKNKENSNDIYRINLPEELRPTAVSLISGRVLDAKTHKAVHAKIIYETLPEGDIVGIARSNPKTGEYKISLPAGSKYGFLAEADGFIAINQFTDLTNDSVYTEKENDLYLVPIEEGQIVKINNIFFEFGKYELLEDSFSELKRILAFLKENPGIIIEIHGHTDNVGTNNFNKRLSINRAKAVMKYLIKNGINKRRLSSKGFGSLKPVASNDTDENRAKNRRVEFLIKSLH